MPSYGLSEFLEEVEADIAWREIEIRTIDRLISASTDDPTRNVLRRSFIALLYAHAEGGVKTALTCYVRVINGQGLYVRDCIPPIVAAAWGDLFYAMSDQNHKHEFFRNRLPENTKLHRFARQSEFVSNIRKMNDLAVEIDHTKVVDTESNLNENVLIKILFQLGFQPNVIDNKFNELNLLRGMRNAIAHGDKTFPTAEKCLKYKNTVLALLPKLRNLLSKAINEESFRRHSA